MPGPALFDTTISLGQLLMGVGLIVGGAFTLAAVIFKYLLSNQRDIAKHDTEISLLKAQCDTHDENAKEFREHQNRITSAIFDQVNQTSNQLSRVLGKLGIDPTAGGGR